MLEKSPVESMHQWVDTLMDSDDSPIENKKKYLKAMLKWVADTTALHASLVVLRKASTTEDEEYKSMLAKVAEDIRADHPEIPVFDMALVEKLSEVEHVQWVSWAKSVSSEISQERLKRWEGYFVPYAKLDEPSKSLDRVWAVKSLAIIQSYQLKYKEDIRNDMLEKMKYAMKVRDEGQFDPDMIASYKNSVLHEVVELMLGGQHEDISAV